MGLMSWDMNSKFLLADSNPRHLKNLGTFAKEKKLPLSVFHLNWTPQNAQETHEPPAKPNYSSRQSPTFLAVFRASFYWLYIEQPGLRIHSVFLLFSRERDDSKRLNMLIQWRHFSVGPKIHTVEIMA